MAGLEPRFFDAAKLGADLLAAMGKAAFPTDADEAWGSDDIALLLRETGTIALVAAIDNEPAGFALGRRVLDEAELYSFAILPQWRRQGLGRALLGRFLDACRDHGVVSIHLEVREDNQAARELYAAAGLIACGRRPDYYRLRDGSRRDAISLQKRPLRDEDRENNPQGL